MKTAKITYLTGIISFGIIGLGHIVLELTGQKPAEITQTMERLTVVMPGKGTNMLLLCTGFSLVMGIMLIAYSMINMLYIFKNKQVTLPPKSIILTNLLLSIIILALAYKYLFIVPVVFMGIAFICFILSLILIRK